MPPESCLARLPVPVELAEGRARGCVHRHGSVRRRLVNTLSQFSKILFRQNPFPLLVFYCAPTGTAAYPPDTTRQRSSKLSNRSIGDGGGRGLFHIGCNTLRDPRGGCFHRLSRKVGVAGRRLHLPVAEELSDHRQALPQRQCPRSEGVTQVMDTNVLRGPEPGASLPRDRGRQSVLRRVTRWSVNRTRGSRNRR